MMILYNLALRITLQAGQMLMQIPIRTKFGAMFVALPHLYHSFIEAGKTTQTTHANK